MRCPMIRILRVSLFILIALLHVALLLYFLKRDDWAAIFQKNIGLSFNTIHIRSAPDSWIHTIPYGYLMKNENACEKVTDDLLLVVLVTSKPTGLKRRQLARSTWARPTNVNGTEVRTVFVLGRSNDANVEQRLQKEQAQYGDLVQIDFYDSYDNLTIKTVMTMRWAVSFCPEAKFLMKTDDDMFVNYYNLVNYLNDLSQQDKSLLYAGEMNSNLHPIRSAEFVEDRKWEVSLQEYPYDDYPPYCTGAAYVLSLNAAKLIYNISMATKFFRMEDVFVGICANKSGISLTDYIGFSSSWYTYSDCRFRFLISSHFISEKFTRNVWKRVNSKHIPKKCPAKEMLIEWYDYDDEEILFIVRQWKNSSDYYDYTL